MRLYGYSVCNGLVSSCSSMLAAGMGREAMPISAVRNVKPIGKWQECTVIVMIKKWKI